MRIDKTYRPELIDDTCYVDAKASRLIVSTERMMVVLPVSVDPRERFGAVDVAGLRAARIRHPEDPQAVLRVTAAPPEDWEARLPGFSRGARGAVTIAVNVGDLKRVADALGVVVVEITTRESGGSLIVQPIDRGALELGVLFAKQPARKSAPKQRKRERRGLDAWGDKILEESGDHDLTKRAIG